MTWMNSRMGMAGHPIWIGGFNLLPYRQRDARRARRRCLLEWSGRGVGRLRRRTGGGGLAGI